MCVLYVNVYLCSRFHGCVYVLSGHVEGEGPVSSGRQGGGGETDLSEEDQW